MVLKLSWISIFAMLWLAIFKILEPGWSYFGFLGIFLLLSFLSAAYAHSENKQSNVSKPNIKRTDHDGSRSNHI